MQEDLRYGSVSNHDQNGAESMGAGDRIFEAAGRIFKGILTGRHDSLSKRIQGADLADLDLPPLLHHLLERASRAVQGKVEDMSEVIEDLKDRGMINGVSFIQGVLSGMNLPTREDISRLESRIEALTAQLNGQSPKMHIVVSDSPNSTHDEIKIRRRGKASPKKDSGKKQRETTGLC